MTVLFDHHGNGATDEADVTTGSGFGTTWNTVFDNGTNVEIKYDTAHATHSSTSIRFTRPASTDNGYCLGQLASAVTRLQATAYVWMDALPAVELSVFTFRNSTPGFMGRFAITIAGQTAGRAGLTNTSATFISGTLAPADFPLSQWVRVEAAIKAGTGAGDGAIEYAYYLGDSTTAVHTASSTTANTGTVNPQGCRFGINGATTTPGSIWIGRPRMGDAATGLIGPIVASTDRDWLVWDGAAWL